MWIPAYMSMADAFFGGHGIDSAFGGNGTIKR